MEALVYLLWRRRSLFLTVGPIVLIVIARPTRDSFLMGVPFVLIGESIRVWSAGYLNKLTDLVTAGPFALCRNPIYVGSFLITLGYLFMCNRLDAWIAGVVSFWLFHGGAIVYEERLLRERFGEVYDDYCKQVPRIVPRPRGTAGAGGFSFRQLILNNEYRGVTAASILTALFALIAYRPDLAPLSWIGGALG